VSSPLFEVVHTKCRGVVMIAFSSTRNENVVEDDSDSAAAMESTEQRQPQLQPLLQPLPFLNFIFSNIQQKNLQLFYSNAKKSKLWSLLSSLVCSLSQSVSPYKHHRKHTERIIPVEASCEADIQAIQQTAKPIITSHFSQYHVRPVHVNRTLSR